MTHAGDDVTIAASTLAPRALVVGVGDATYTVEPGDAPIVIGREFPAQVQIPDPRISRTHARLEAPSSGWVVVDQSTNGIFLGGVRQSSVPVADGMTLHLGNAEGIAVTFALRPAAYASDAGFDHDPFGGADGDPEDVTEHSDITDPGIMRAGAAVAARRRELDIAQRALAKDKIMNAGALIAFEKGRSWPRRATLTKLEEVLGWAPGTINRIRLGHEPVDPEPHERTEVLSGAVQAPLMSQAVDVALDAIRTQIEYLPPPSSAEFTERVQPVLADLRRLEGVAANAARSATGAADVVRSLSAVRRTHRELMSSAAMAPKATFGQRLFAARQGAQLSTEEAANAAGVTVESIDAAEADAKLPPDVTAAVQALLRSLAY